MCKKVDITEPGWPSRSVFGTINNPEKAGLNHEVIKEKLSMNSTPRYYCMSDEIGAEGTYHTHFYVYFDSPIRFSTMKNRLPTAHLEPGRGNAVQIIDYIKKGGTWSGTEKAGTSVPGTFEEWGTPPAYCTKEEKASMMSQVLDMAKRGYSTLDIINAFPSLALKVRDLDLLCQRVKFEKYRMEAREVEVIYMWGAAGTGMIQRIYDKHGADKIYRVTHYRNGKDLYFDEYDGQKVMVFDNYREQIPVADMLRYLDRFPLRLHARYNNKDACYTTVYIVSSLPLGEQYRAAQVSDPETWSAFLEKITKVVEFHLDGSITEHNLRGGNI